MIRTAYPITPLRRVQLRLELAARRTRYALQARRKALAFQSSRPPLEAVSAPKAAEMPAVLKTDEKNEKADFETFYDRYDALTALICLAAQDGVTRARENRYQTDREWFVQIYPAGIAGIEEWESYGRDEDDLNGKEKLFAGFWTPPTLALLLQNDDGSLIERMEQSYDVLSLWEKALCVPSAAPKWP